MKVEPALAEALEIGLAWKEAEAALPEGWVLSLGTNEPSHKSRYEASAGDWKRPTEEDAHYDRATPAKALRAILPLLKKHRALAIKLRGGLDE